MPLHTHENDRGGISLVVLAVAMATLFLGSAVLAIGALAVRQSQLGQIADETARAAAIALVGGTDPCAAARAFLIAPGVELRGCEVTDSVTVDVTEPAPQLLKRWGLQESLHATARAGP